MTLDFFQLFPKKSVIGMLHLAGENKKERVKRALDEIDIFEQQGIHGVIVEDYHGSEEDVERTLEAIKERGTNLVLGVNVLRDPYLGLTLANKYEAKFVQFDTINSPDITPDYFNNYRIAYQNIFILGGVRFKYIKPTGRALEEDIAEGMSRCEAIVTTGEGTGIETPTKKLMDFRRVMGNFPLVVGAGVNPRNFVNQMKICNAAIIGSYFKDGNTERKINSIKVRDMMRIFKGLIDDS